MPPQDKKADEKSIFKMNIYAENIIESNTNIENCDCRKELVTECRITIKFLKDEIKL